MAIPDQGLSEQSVTKIKELNDEVDVKTDVEYAELTTEEKLAYKMIDDHVYVPVAQKFILLAGPRKSRKLYL